MKLALIGASGFVGTHLIKLLKKDSNHELLNIDKSQSQFYPEITQISDVRNLKDIEQKLQNVDLVVLLAAEHADNVSPKSLYYDVNVKGMENVLLAMKKNNVKRIVFTSSVAVYGLNKPNPNEEFPKDPFNDYGKSKWMAEQLLQDYYINHKDWNINIVRPTVIFGEQRRGNVFNLLSQLSSGKFLMVGNGKNKKSMSYVGNIAAFIKFLIEFQHEGYNEFIYSDKPDYDMNNLISFVGKVSKKNISTTHYPYWLGMIGGYCFDLLAIILNKKLTVSSIRIKKFCASTEFDSSKIRNIGFIPPYTIEQGLENTLHFLISKQD